MKVVNFRREHITLVLALIPLIALTSCIFTQPKVKLYRGKVFFDGDKAYSLLKVIVSKYKNRVIGTEADKAIAYWIADYFKSLGLEAYIQTFVAPDFRKRNVKAYNVFAIKRGSLDKYIVLIAHHDIVPWTIEGANDNGGGVAVLMELARVLANRSLKLSVIFLSTDAEETGLHGSKFFVENFPDVEKVVAAISIDMCTWKNAEAVALYAFVQCGNPFVTGDGGLLYLIKLHEAFGYKIKVAEPVVAVRLGVLGFFGTDSEPFVSKGIQGVGLGDYPTYPYWHRPEDSIDKVSPERLKEVGSLLERIVLTIDLNGGVPSIGVHYYFVDSIVVGEASLLTAYLALYFLALYQAGTIAFYCRRRAFRGFYCFFFIFFSSLLIFTLLFAWFWWIKDFYSGLAVASAVYLILMLKTVLPRCHVEWKELKFAAIVSGLVFYSVAAINYSAGLLLLAPLMYLISLAKPIKRKIVKYSLRFSAPLIVFFPELFFFYKIGELLGFRESSRILALTLNYMVFKSTALIALLVVFSSLLISVIVSVEHIIGTVLLNENSYRNKKLNANF